MTRPEPRRLGRRTILAMAAAVLATAVPLGLLLTPRASGRPLAIASPAEVPSPTPSAAPAVLALGKNTFEERCSTCHGPTGLGTAQGPPIAGLGAAYYDFMMSTGRMPLDQPNTQARPRPPVLTPAEINAVTAYLESIAPGGVPVPKVHPALGSLSFGEATFQANCAPCHGITGRGGSVGPQDAPPVVHADSTQIAEAIRIGPGTMPVFDESTIDQHALNSLVRYVEYLRAPDNRGGAGLGGIGPLVEGFVALAGGLVLIVLVTRTIGTRS